MKASRPRFAALTLIPLALAAACQSTSEYAATSSKPEALAKDALGAQLGVETNELTVVASGQAHFAYLERTVSTFKVSDAKGQWFGTALDEELRPVDVEELTLADRKARLKKQGALDDAVAQMLAAGAKQLNVILWLASGGETPKRPEASDKPLSPKDIDAIYAETDRQRAATLEGIVGPVLKQVKSFDPEAHADTLSPSIAATLSAEALAVLARDPAIDRIYFEPSGEPELDVAKAATGVPPLHAAGITGKGVRVAITEILGGRAEPNSFFLGSFIQDSQNVCSTVSDHATEVAAIFKERRINLFGTLYAENGITPDAELLVGGFCGAVANELHAASSRAANWGARAINLSWGQASGNTPGPSDRFYDDLVFNRFRTITKSAGNRGDNPGCVGRDNMITSPGLAYNVITVGGIDDRNTPIGSDDTMYSCSSFTNPTSTSSDREKPELVAPAVNLTLATNGPANLVTVTGTSGAAPQVAAAAALLIQKNSRLAFWPEIVRATTMATARNIEGASRLSSLDGAGALMSGAAADLIGDPARWNGIGYSCSNPASMDLMTLSVGPRTRHRVVLSWDTDPSVTDYATRPSVDIDLVIVDSLGRMIAASSSFDNTYEIVEFDSFLAGTYTLQAKKFRCDARTWLGWAWGTTPMPRLKAQP